ncbi:FkbM family methyltransferase [Aquabacter sediminis]|uniref:FkbM family methyltransferase n=1 Tax=Aquabacter sediminis TaxID=3029197 RepID=UPI00237DC20D|nr:FkbM family methyltransferase [Aquabacter sp. P-9]MDE1570648.1 FkbM family methyltransferase [Aquabacter sp. P-9]
MSLSPAGRMVMDLGMNNGDDTAYYLAKGFDVVALEANPALAAAARIRFAQEIAAGHVHLEEAAIWSSAGTVTFHVNEANDHWSSIEPVWAGREDTPTRAVEMPAVTLEMLFARHGVPHYLKIDVEGVDSIVLEQVRAQARKPDFVSVEDCRFGFHYIAALAEAGYGAFTLVDQSQVPAMRDPDLPYVFPKGASGPWGEALPGPWLDRHAFEDLYATTVRDRAGTRIAPRTSWFDIHARMA